MPLRRFLSALVLTCFFVTSVLPFPKASAEFGLDLPAPGSMVGTTEAFTPALIRGLKIHPEDPLRFDFIVDQGDSHLQGQELSQECQRMINYFLASLTIPQKDLWVNLSPVEKDRIVPDTLIKTELGRDLLSMDYMLKQLTASLVYPEQKVGKDFWSKVYAQARERFGSTDMPVNTFNKVWIVPEKASVYEQGNTAYITKIHLKVMLESDYLAREKITKGQSLNSKEETSKQLLREVIVPVIEKEVNEGKAYAQLRQMVYALTLAQWYQDVFKNNLLNKDYSNKSKLSGIDLSSPENKKIIYQQYLEAYKKGVFNYIKEEKDPVTQAVTPRKFFSGGFHVDAIRREPASLAEASQGGSRRLIVEADLGPVRGSGPASAAQSAAQSVEDQDQWYNLERPLSLLKEIEGLFDADDLNEERFGVFMDKYSRQVDSQPLYPVQSAWPVLKAITLLSKEKEEKIVKAVQGKYTPETVTRLADAILLMNNKFLDGIDLIGWLAKEAPHIKGRRIYMTAAEIHYQEGGLGPVMEFHGKGMHDLGADIAYIEPDYQTRQDRGKIEDKLDYRDMGIVEDVKEELDPSIKEFTVRVGDLKDKMITHDVKVQVHVGRDRNGVLSYRFRDVQPDGSSFYTKMLYKYGKDFNPVTQEESMTFINVVTAELISRLEKLRSQKTNGEFRPAIVYNNDGQLAPVQAVLQSNVGRYDTQTRQALKGIFFAFTTHTYYNRGKNDDVNWGVDHFLIHMMKISKRFVNAFRRTVDGRERIDFTSGGVNLADWVGAVSSKHRDDVSPWDPNSKVVAVANAAVPERTGANYHRVYRELVPENGDYQRPKALELAGVKRALKKELNNRKIRTAGGGIVDIDPNLPTIGYTRRLVPEKAGRGRAFTDENIIRLVKLGYNVVLMGRNQRYKESEDISFELKRLEREIATAKEEKPNLYPGRFFFVESFPDEDKLAAQGAFDVDVKDSDNHTGANEQTEEDQPANGGYEAGATWREGAIVDQGIVMKMVFRNGKWVVENPGSGNTLMPQEDTADSWFETVYKPMKDLWDQGPEVFYAGAAKSPSINRIMSYLITSSVYLLEWEATLARQEQEELADARLIQEIHVESLPKDQLAGLLRDGRNGIDKPFGFMVFGLGEKLANNKGLVGFIEKREELEYEYGFDALLGHFKEGSYQAYFKELFKGTSLEGVLVQFIEDVDSSADSTLQKFARFERFIDTVAQVLSQAEKASPAQASQKAETSAAQAINREGGIDLRHVTVGREGRLISDIFSDSALESILANIAGLRGNIIAIKPVGDLKEVLEGIK